MTNIQPITQHSNKTFGNFSVPKIRYNIPVYKNELQNKDKVKIALSAFFCAIAPVIILNSFKKGNIENIINSFKNKLSAKEKFKAVWNMFEIENYWQILATTIGGVSGGLLGGLKYDKNKENREAKYKEGIFEFLNNMTPTTLVALGLSALKKIGKSKSVPHQAGVILSSVVGGMFIANKASNKINEKLFDKDKKTKDYRKFKFADCLVHVDDLVNLAVLAKIPLASQFQIDKLLPFIYARTGYEVGIAKKKNPETK